MPNVHNYDKTVPCLYFIRNLAVLHQGYLFVTLYAIGKNITNKSLSLLVFEIKDVIS